MMTPPTTTPHFGKLSLLQRRHFKRADLKAAASKSGPESLQALQIATQKAEQAETNYKRLYSMMVGGPKAHFHRAGAAKLQMTGALSNARSIADSRLTELKAQEEKAIGRAYNRDTALELLGGLKNAPGKFRTELIKELGQLLKAYGKQEQE